MCHKLVNGWESEGVCTWADYLGIRWTCETSLIVHLWNRKFRIDVAGVTFLALWLIAALFFSVGIEQASVQRQKRGWMHELPTMTFGLNSCERDSKWPWLLTSLPWKYITERILLCQGHCFSWEQLPCLALSVFLCLFLCSKLGKKNTHTHSFIFTLFF